LVSKKYFLEITAKHCLINCLKNKFFVPLFFSKALANPIEPTFDAYRDVRLLLSTRQNLGNPYRLLFRNQANLDASPFNANRPTRLLVHGWWEDDTSDIKVGTSEELLAYYDFNM
jgi:hypothetical protein